MELVFFLSNTLRYFLENVVNSYFDILLPNFFCFCQMPTGQRENFNNFWNLNIYLLLNSWFFLLFSFTQKVSVAMYSGLVFFIKFITFHISNTQSWEVIPEKMYQRDIILKMAKLQNRCYLRSYESIDLFLKRTCMKIIPLPKLIFGAG